MPGPSADAATRAAVATARIASRRLARRRHRGLSEAERGWAAGRLPCWLHGSIIVLLRGPPADLIPEIEETIAEVESGLADWRLNLQHEDRTGRVADAERAGAAILESLADVRCRAYRAIQ